MDQEETRRVVTTMPLLIDNAERPAGLEMELPAAAAQLMIDEGRAKAVRVKKADDPAPPEQTPAPAAVKKEG